MNYVGITDWPLVLGIFGRPGDGKSFQARVHLRKRQVDVISINAADLESDRAGQPGKMVLARYAEAGERSGAGVPAVLLIDDFDTTVGEWVHNTGTVNHQQVLAQLMHLADSPTQAADKPLRRVPVLVTGNDLTKIYPPLRRPGRMRPFIWEPTQSERHSTVAAILADVTDDDGVTKVLAACDAAPISFFSDLRTSLLAESANGFIEDLSARLPDVVNDPRRHYRYLLAELRDRRLSPERLIRLARSHWHQRQLAATSHVNK
jgi:SpoVK/Ycf46/Vps4 family AAA+-type ATPase